MSTAGSFPLPHPIEAKSPFGTEAAARQLAKVARLAAGTHVLEVGAAGSLLGTALGDLVGCEVTLSERDRAALEAVKASLEGYDPQDYHPVILDPASPQFPPASFDAIIIHVRGLIPLGALLETYRPLLRRNGRLAITWPTRVGRHPAEASVALWERRLGEKPILPRELLLRLGAEGLEPEAADTLSDPEMDEIYRSVEPLLGKLSAEDADVLREEIATHRAQNGKAGVAYTRVIARRREPGEKPPTSRDRG